MLSGEARNGLSDKQRSEAPLSGACQNAVSELEMLRFPQNGRLGQVV